MKFHLPRGSLRHCPVVSYANKLVGSSDGVAEALKGSEKLEPD